MYPHFGDVVVMDATYDTNKYRLKFVPFVGVNHNNQTIMFGDTLLLRETIENYEWLISTLLGCMSGSKHPEVMITDQDKALIHVMPIVLPRTKHRYCIWHIMAKFTIKMLKEWFDTYYPLFLNIIYDSQMMTQFE